MKVALNTGGRGLPGWGCLCGGGAGRGGGMLGARRRFLQGASGTRAVRLVRLVERLGELLLTGQRRQGSK
jgi:hypothetical protein